jgi:hypothetical protein
VPSYRRPESGFLQETGDIVLAIALTLAAVIATAAWLTGQLAALLAHGDWPPVSIGQALAAAWRLPGHLRDPRRAWPAPVRRELPGPGEFIPAGIMALAIVAALVVFLGRAALRYRRRRGFASAAEIRAVLSERAVLRRGTVVRPSLREKRR